MKISMRTRYGLRAMVELAVRQGNGRVMMQSIAENQGVSRKYLDTIFASLKAAGLIHSRRGIGGGHVLGKPPDEIRLGDIVRAIEGPLSLIDCVNDPLYCARTHRCATRDVWTEVTEAVEQVLDRITLADLIQREELKQLEARQQMQPSDGSSEQPSDEEATDAERCLLETPTPTV